MATQENRLSKDPLLLRGESGQLLTTPEIAARIENFVPTPEGTLRSIEGPLPYVPRDKSGNFPSIYSTMRGVFHATLRGGATDILLLHTGTGIYSFRGWRPSDPWEEIAGGAGTQVPMSLPDSSAPQFPTQFEATPTGIVIVPHGGRAIFFDGDVALPLGYSETPGPLTGYGPTRVSTTSSQPNDRTGYAVSAHPGDSFTQHEDFGNGRLGTLHAPIAVDDGHTVHSASSVYVKTEYRAGMVTGEYQASYQWVDFFGNLSPLAARSNGVTLYAQTCSAGPEEVPNEQPLKHLLWQGLASGPKGTIGRNISRTRDTLNSGTQKLFQVPSSVGVVTYGAFATVADNVSDQWPDNVPDNWCLVEPHDIQPVPLFKLCRLAFGRLWIANTNEEPGLLVPSMPGRYGTFPRGGEMFPDSGGGEITGLYTVPAGMLVFTASSTFLLTQGADGTGFLLNSLSSSIGCVAPSSCASLTDGTAVWLGREGFYAFTGEGIVLASGALKLSVNPTRAKAACAVFDSTHKEYRCWAASTGSTENDTCYTFDGANWRRRVHEKLAAVCVTKDHRQYTIGVGTTEKQFELGDFGSMITRGIWVLDRSHGKWPAKAPTATIETGWMTWTTSQQRRSAKTVYVALRETNESNLTLKVYRDWRMGGTPVYEDKNVTLHPVEDVPPLWGTTTYDDGSEWVRRRLYWKRIDVSVPACEVFKIVLETPNPFEFMAIAFDEEPKLGGLASRIT